MDDTQKKMTEGFDIALKHLDKMFQYIPLASPFIVDFIIHDYQPEAYDYSQQINVLLLDKFKYADEYNGRYWITLNEKGMAAKNAVGHFIYHQKQEELKQKQERKQQVDLKIAEWMVTTYWWTFGFAIAAFGISLTLLIITIKKLAS